MAPPPWPGLPRATTWISSNDCSSPGPIPTLSTRTASRRFSLLCRTETRGSPRGFSTLVLRSTLSRPMAPHRLALLPMRATRSFWRDCAPVDVVCANGWTPLTLAALGGHTAIAESLLAAGANVDCTTTHGGASLFIAAEYGHLEVVEKLLNARANVDLTNSDGLTPLHIAVVKGHATIVAKLLDAGADVNRTKLNGYSPLQFAAQLGDSSIIDRLLAAGARVDAYIQGTDTPLSIAAFLGHFEAVKRLLAACANVELADPAGNTAIIHSARYGHALVVEKLIAAEARLDAKNGEGSALTCAAMHGHVDVARMLLEAGADPLSRHCNGLTASEIFQANGNVAMATLVRDFQPSATTYFNAVERGNMGVVKRLARASSSFRAQNNSTPLHIAAKLGKFEAVKVLVEGGAALAARDDAGWTPLHFACSKGDLESILFLMDNGALAAAVNDLGYTSVNVAAVYGHAEVVRALADRGVSLQTVSTGSEDGRTILHHTVWGRSKALLEYLLAQGVVNVNTVDAHGRSPLHHAVYALASASADATECNSQLAVLRVLLATAGVNINAQDSEGRTPLFVGSQQDDARSVRALLDAGARTDIADNSGKTPLTVAASSDIQAVVELFHKSQQYHEKCFALLNIQDATPVESAELLTLVPLITSVYDLRLMLTVCTVHADVAGGGSALKAAFDHVVASKLTFDDEACVYFKLMLEHCERGQLITRGDFLLLDRRAEKANTESAEWVVELKRHVHTNSWRLDAHERHMAAITDNINRVHSLVMENRANINQVATHLADFQRVYVSRLEQEERAKRIKLVCGVLASVGGFVFAGMVDNWSESVVAFGNPSDIVTKILKNNDLASFLKDTAKDQVKGILQEKLQAFAIPQDKFEDLLRVGLALTRPELIPQDSISAALDDLKSADVEPQMQRLQIESQPRGTRNILAEMSRSESIQTGSDSSNEPQLCDPDTFPCHAAVQKSFGDAVAFQKLLEAIGGDVDANAVAQVRLTESVTTREALCAAQYAYLLGYTEVGDAISASMNNPLQFDKVPATSVELQGDIDEYPFVHAVAESDGNVQAYDDFLGVLDTDEHTMEDTAEALVVRDTRNEVAWTVVEFACHLGYVDVVKLLFKDVYRSMPPKARVLSMKQARERAKVLSERSLVSSGPTAA